MITRIAQVNLLVFLVSVRKKLETIIEHSIDHYVY